MVSKLRNVLSLILVLVMLISIVPTEALAAAVKRDDSSPTQPDESIHVGRDLTAEDIVGEDIKLRTANTKQFRIADGSYIAVQYDTDVHYKDEKDKWQDIDNGLVSNKDVNSLTAESAEGYTVKNNGEDVTFAANGGQGKEFETQNGKYSVSFALNNAHTAEGKIIKQETKKDDSLNSAIALPNISSSILYSGIQEGIDLQYTMYGNEVKEAIIVNQKQDSYSYSFALKLKNLTPVLNEDGSISLNDSTSGENIYLIPAPYMFDSDNSISTDVKYTLDTTEKGKYVLTVTADPNWMNDSARQFPISIDPTLVQRSSSSNTEVTYVTSGYPNTNHNGYSRLYLGYDSGGSYKNRILMRVNSLPSLPDNSVVVNATMYYGQIGYSYVGLSSMNVEAHALTSHPTSLRDATWNTQPSYSNEIVDYTTLSTSTNSTYVGWDLTRLTKGWYDGDANNGVVLMAANEASMSGSSCAKASFYSVVNPLTYVVQYRNNVGLEDYYTYQTQDIGRAGTGYVSDYSTQLTISKTDVSNAGAISFALSHYYNSSYAWNNFTSGYSHTADYSNMLMGSGWKLSAQQSVVQTTLKDPENNDVNYLVYTDADGTEHYFSYDSDDGLYHDEDGLDLKIQVTTYSGMTDYKMTDSKDNIMEFYNGLLSKVTDANGNRIYFFYNNATASLTGTNWCPTGSGDRLLAIKQLNAGESNPITLATLAYDSNGYLQSITDRADNQTTYTYGMIGAVKILRTITHADSTTVKYTYDPDFVKLTKATDNEIDRSMTYSYDPVNRKTIGIQELGVSGAVGNTLYLWSFGDGVTKYRDIGADRERYTDDDILTYYLFDNGGHTINKYSTDSSGNTILGATANVYEAKSGTSDKNNKLSGSTTAGVSAVNILKDGGMESSSVWSPSGNGTGHTLSLASDLPRTGAKSQKATFSGYSGEDFFSQGSISVTVGTTYTYSAYINTRDVDSMNDGGVYLIARDSTYTYTSDLFKVITDEYVNDGWQRISLTFTPTTNTASLYIFYSQFEGTAYADDAQLEVGSAPSNYNLLDEGGFNNGIDWQLSSNVSYDTTNKIGGSGKSLKINGSPNDYYYAYQNAPINLDGSQTYKLSGWAKAASVPMNSEDRSFDIHAIVYYSDGSPSEDYYAKFNPDSTQWQYSSAIIVPKQSGTVSNIKIYCEYGNNGNTANFDNISLVRELAQTYTYDEDGNLTSVTATKNDDVSYSYDGADLISAVSGSNGTYDYTYDDAHNVETVENNDVTMSLSYDAKGNATSSTLSGTSGKSINSSATYTDAGNLLSSETNSLGSTITYEYIADLNKMMGQPLYVTDANDVTTTHSRLGGNGRLSYSYIDGVISLSRNYTDGRLDLLIRNGHITTGDDGVAQFYTFNYDDFGNPSSVIVGRDSGHTLASYSYGAQNGSLSSMLYGNGDSVTFDYDTLGRKTSLLYNDGTGYNYTYTGDGQLYQVATADGSDKTTYDYDDIGRLIHSNQVNTDTGITQYFRQSYDNSNRPLGFGYIINFPDGTPINEYELNTYGTNGALEAKRTGIGDNLIFGYDYLKRMGSKTVKDASNNTMYYRYFAYADGPTANTTTTLPSGMRYYDPGWINMRYFGYTYDVMGNIETITNDSGTVASYTYDSQNQVTSETLPEENLTYTYNYDTYGNIRSVTSEPIDGGTVTTNTYTYSDSTWKDLLTAYNGQTITYDEIGNPLSYYDGATMTWQNGRRLTSLTKDSATTSYVYNVDGIRTQKTVDGVEHNYVLDGTRILADYSDGAELRFYYDENNSPQSFTYNGTKYNYITNLQGDVVEIRDTSNNVVGNYVYNAYGKIISMSGSMASVNPLRYRGYYYDTETGFYYLNSRYYDPEIGRFINADSLIDTDDFLGYNLFAYCENNPVMRADPSGHCFMLVTAVIGAVAGAIVGGVIAAKNGKNVLAGVGIGAAAGALVGLGAGAAAGVLLAGSATASTAAVMTGAGTLAAQVFNTMGQAITRITEKVPKAPAATTRALQTYYPPNNGFAGAAQKVTLDAGTLIQRTGDLAGRFTSPAGTPPQMLSLPYDKIGQATTIFQVQQPIQALSGKVAPWFGQLGGGTQYLLLDGRVDQLMRDGVITIFGG